MKVSRKGLLAVAFAAMIGSTAVYAAGNYLTYPVIGGNPFCIATTTGAGAPFSGATGQGQGTTGSICAQTVPAGPTNLSDEEMVLTDVEPVAGGNAPTQSAKVPTGVLGALNLKINRLIGGDFATNLWQRGTTPLSGASPTVATMAADRWWAIAASNVVTVSKQTPASSAADYLGNIGFYSWMRVARPSGTPSGATCVGQTLDQEAAAPLIGKNAILSFYGYAPSTFSATNSAITVTIAYFTAADGAATQAAIGNAGANSSTFALSASGQANGIAGYTAAVGGTGPGTSGTLASGVETISLTTTPTNYSVWAPIPATNASGTAITGVGIAICATPTLTTTVSTDYFEITGVQLQGMPGGATASLPNGIISPTGFERRPAAIEQLNQLYYSYVVNESITAVNFRGMCAVSSTSLANCQVHFPTPMRLAPAMKYTAGFGECTTTACTAQAACTALTTSATVTGLAATPNDVLVDCASSAAFAAAGSAGFLMDKGSAGGAGVISASAEP